MTRDVPTSREEKEVQKGTSDLTEGRLEILGKTGNITLQYILSILLLPKNTHRISWTMRIFQVDPACGQCQISVLPQIVQV